jgi:hypothetical protein
MFYYTILAPGGTKCFVIPFSPWRQKCFIDLFGPWRHKSYKHATPLGSILNNVLTPEGSHVSCYLAPGGTKCFIIPFSPWRQKCFIDLFGPWRHKSYKHATPLGSILNNVLTPEGSHVSCYLAPGGTKCFIIPFSPWRHKMFY